jgi:anti-sigma regulatory factor (Ser/Thr protein kinase)
MDAAPAQTADPSETPELVLPPALDSVPAARHYVQRLCLQAHLPPRLCAEATLLTGEIVANVVRHVRTEARIRVHAKHNRLVVVVSDDGDVTAAVKPVQPNARGGRGLRIVDTIANSWGVQPHARGKAVWFQLCTGA